MIRQPGIKYVATLLQLAALAVYYPSRRQPSYRQYLAFNPANGDLTNVVGYGIASSVGTLDPAEWFRIAANYDAGNRGPNQLDPNNNWTILSDVTGGDRRHE